MMSKDLWLPHPYYEYDAHVRAWKIRNNALSRFMRELRGKNNATNV